MLKTVLIKTVFHFGAWRLPGPGRQRPPCGSLTTATLLAPGAFRLPVVDARQLVGTRACVVAGNVGLGLNSHPGSGGRREDRSGSSSGITSIVGL